MRSPIPESQSSRQTHWHSAKWSALVARQRLDGRAGGVSIVSRTMGCPIDYRSLEQYDHWDSSSCYFLRLTKFTTMAMFN